jgi:hypothetical protein
MYKYLSLLVVLCLSGCVLIYDDRDYDYYYEASTVEGLDASCYYNYNDQHDWYFETWGSPDLAYVDVYINSWKWVPLAKDGQNYWSGALMNTYFYCDNTYDFEVVAEDYSGNVTYRMFYW